MKTILITGASSGIGCGLAKHFLKTSNVIVLGKNYPVGVSGTGNLSFIEADLNSPGEIEAILKSNIGMLREVNVLINNAGVVCSKPFLLQSNEEIWSQVSVNFAGHLIVSKFVSRILIKKRAGRIIFIGSMASRVKAPGDTVYAATKAANEVFAATLNAELSPFNITVNTLAVSATDTGMLKDVTKGKPETVLKHIPMGSFSVLADITNTLDFLISDASSQIGGQTIFLGGIS